MPLYQYKAYNQQGKVMEGLIDAPSNKAAYAKIKDKGLYPRDIKMDSSTASASVSRESLAFALTQLSSLLSAGISMTKALDSLITQTESKSLGRSFARLKNAIEEGKSFSEGMKSDKIFPPLLVKMAQSGESVGNLELILDRYAGFLEKEAQSIKKVVSSMIYPAVVMFSSIGLVMFILAFIAPTLTEIFSQFNRKLPLTTTLLVSSGTFIRSNFIFILLALAALFYLFRNMIPKKTKDCMVLSIPVVGAAYRDIMYSRWSRTLGLLHGGGVPLLHALESSRDVVDNVELEGNLISVEKNVEKGLSLSAALSRYFPPLLVNMVETGLQTGELDKMMGVAGDFYEREADRRLGVFIQLFEPAMILLLGGVVGFVVVSILLPIFDINTLVK